MWMIVVQHWAWKLNVAWRHAFDDVLLNVPFVENISHTKDS